MESLNADSTSNWIEHSWAHLVLLGLLGLLAFFHNLSVSLFGDTEGLYAAVTETMVRTGEYVHLTLNREPYLNKPPMFFWLQALSSKVLGWNEVALRLPSALFGFGTMVVTYLFGKTLFSRTAGFWAALVITTSYATVWFGQMAIIDPILTFFMTLGLWGFAQAYFQKGTRWWYVMGFMALACGAMVKNLHAFAMPGLLFLGLLWIFRDGKPLKTLPFWTGCVLFGALLGSYYAFLGEEFWQHYFFQENLTRITKEAGDIQRSALEAYFGSRPIHWYFYTLWFDFFPWSALLPSSLILLWRQQPFRQYPRETFILFWAIGYFLAFSLFPEKHERYLMPLVPAIALLIGYGYHRIWQTGDLQDRAASLIKIMLGILSVAFIMLGSIGPFFVQKKLSIPTDVFPLVFQGTIVLCGGTLMYFVFRSQIRNALNMVGLLAVGFMISIVMFIVPGIDAGASPKRMFTEIRSYLKNPNDLIYAFQNWDWRTDEDLYYWQHVHEGALIIGWGSDDAKSLKILKDELQKRGHLLILMTKKQYHQSVSRDPELIVQILREFLRPGIKVVLVSVQLQH